MDVVIPLGRNSKWDSNEIRFAVRSYYKHFKDGVGRIFIVGERPKFFNFNENLIHIPFTESKAKEVNIWEKVLKACKDERVSEEFLFTNDDYFLTDDIDIATLPHYYKGDLKQYPWASKTEHAIRNSYDRKSKYTLEVLESLQLGTLHFDIHMPNRYEKAKFIEAYEKFKPYLYQKSGVLISTCYGNYHKLEGTKRQDLKLAKADLSSFFDKPKPLLFSIFDNAQTPELLEWMHKTFPEKSPFEND